MRPHPHFYLSAVSVLPFSSFEAKKPRGSPPRLRNPRNDPPDCTQRVHKVLPPRSTYSSLASPLAPNLSDSSQLRSTPHGQGPFSISTPTPSAKAWFYHIYPDVRAFIALSGRRSIDENGLSMIPTSPTLSTQSSVHFTTYTALRDNKPGDETSSLALLSPKDHSRSHSRRPSNVTMTSTDEGTVANHSPGVAHLYPATSNVTTSARSAVETLNWPTPTHVGSTSNIGEFESRMQDRQKSGYILISRKTATLIQRLSPSGHITSLPSLIRRTSSPSSPPAESLVSSMVLALTPQSDLR